MHQKGTEHHTKRIELETGPPYDMFRVSTVNKPNLMLTKHLPVTHTKLKQFSTLVLGRRSLYRFVEVGASD